MLSPFSSHENIKQFQTIVCGANFVPYTKCCSSDAALVGSV